MEHEKSPLRLIYHELTSTPPTYTYATHIVRFQDHAGVITESSTDRCGCEITFDDGHRSQFQHATAILAENKLRARFFITTAWTDLDSNYMTSAQLRQLAQAGHILGTHGATHTFLTHCSRTALKEELDAPKKRLEDILGSPVLSMSLPGGRFNRRVLDACTESGYTQVFTSDPLIEVHDVGGAQILGRFNVLNTLSADLLRQLLAPESQLLKAELRRAQRKRFIKALLGDSLYHQIWSVLSHSRSPWST